MEEKNKNLGVNKGDQPYTSCDEKLCKASIRYTTGLNGQTCCRCRQGIFEKGSFCVYNYDGKKGASDKYICERCILNILHIMDSM